MSEYIGTAYVEVRAAGDVPVALARVWAQNPPRPDRLAYFLAGMPELFELWDFYYDAEGPVQQASALIEVSNHLFNMKTRWDQVGEDDD